MLAKRFFYAILAGLLATNVRPSQKWANLKNFNDNDAGHFGVLVFLIVYILIIELFSKSDRTKAGRYNARARSLQKLSLRRRHEFLSSRGIVKAKMVQVRRNLRLRPSLLLRRGNVKAKMVQLRNLRLRSKPAVGGGQSKGKDGSSTEPGPETTPSVKKRERKMRRQCRRWTCVRTLAF